MTPDPKLVATLIEIWLVVGSVFVFIHLLIFTAWLFRKVLKK